MAKGKAGPAILGFGDVHSVACGRLERCGAYEVEGKKGFSGTLAVIGSSISLKLTQEACDAIEGEIGSDVQVSGELSAKFDGKGLKFNKVTMVQDADGLVLWEDSRKAALQDLADSQKSPVFK